MRRRLFFGLLLLNIVLALLLAYVLPAHSQVVLWPGQGIQICNQAATTTGNGVICSHQPSKSRILVTYSNSMWFRSFWGDGTAPSLYRELCNSAGISHVVEVMRRERLIRSLDCSTGDSGPWVQGR